MAGLLGGVGDGGTGSVGKLGSAGGRGVSSKERPLVTGGVATTGAENVGGGVGMGGDAGACGCGTTGAAAPGMPFANSLAIRLL